MSYPVKIGQRRMFKNGTRVFFVWKYVNGKYCIKYEHSGSTFYQDADYIAKHTKLLNPKKESGMTQYLCQSHLSTKGHCAPYDNARQATAAYLQILATEKTHYPLGDLLNSITVWKDVTKDAT